MCGRTTKARAWGREIEIRPLAEAHSRDLIGRRQRHGVLPSPPPPIFYNQNPIVHCVQIIMPADRLLATLLRSLQTYSNQQDTPR